MKFIEDHENMNYRFFPSPNELPDNPIEVQMILTRLRVSLMKEISDEPDIGISGFTYDMMKRLYIQLGGQNPHPPVFVKKDPLTCAAMYNYNL